MTSLRAKHPARSCSWLLHNYYSQYIWSKRICNFHSFPLIYFFKLLPTFLLFKFNKISPLIQGLLSPLKTINQLVVKLVSYYSTSNIFSWSFDAEKNRKRSLHYLCVMLYFYSHKIILNSLYCFLIRSN